MSHDDFDDDDLPPETEAGGAGNGGKNNDRVAAADGNDDDYVGYGHPPKRHRFPPGRSGNPNGRPKGARGMKAMLRKELNTRVRITENGKSRSVTKMEVMIKRLTEQGAKGDLKAISKLIELGAQVFGMDDEPDRSEPLSAEDQAIIDAARHRLAWLAQQAEEQTDKTDTPEDLTSEDGEEEE